MISAHQQHNRSFPCSLTDHSDLEVNRSIGEIMDGVRCLEQCREIREPWHVPALHPQLLVHLLWSHQPFKGVEKHKIKFITTSIRKHLRNFSHSPPKQVQFSVQALWSQCPMKQIYNRDALKEIGAACRYLFKTYLQHNCNQKCKLACHIWLEKDLMLMHWSPFKLLTCLIRNSSTEFESHRCSSCSQRYSRKGRSWWLITTEPRDETD